MVASRTGWLNNNVIAAAQMLILQHFPNMAGLQLPALQKVFAFQVHSGEFVQIINVGNKHWCVVSTVGCDNGVVEVYDSLCTSIPVKTICLIASLICSTASKLVSCLDHTPTREKGLVTIARFLGCAESGVLFSRKPIRL